MIEGRPHLLVVGGADTGRAPLLAAILRRELGTSVSVASVGVLGHAGEPADQSVDLALDQIGLATSGHVARLLDAEALRPADLVLAVDRGIALAVRPHTTLDVVALGELAGSEDVPDPHRMPLGIWIAALQTYLTQISAALPQIRVRLGAGEPHPPAAPKGHPPTGRGGEKASAPKIAAANSNTSPPRRGEGQVVGSPSPSRNEHLTRIARLIDTAETLPEIVDWARLADETATRLRALAGLASEPDDLTPAAAAILIGSVLQSSRMPDAAGLAVLRRVCERLAEPLDSAGLAEIGRVAGEWWVASPQA